MTVIPLMGVEKEINLTSVFVRKVIKLSVKISASLMAKAKILR
jgi:hypothetical protein